MPIPNGDEVLAEYLREVDDLPRVVNSTPDNLDKPWVRLSQLAAPSETEPVDHLIRFMIQVDCFSGKDGGRSEATDIGIAVRDAIKSMPGQTEGAVTTGTECVGDSDSLDTAIPREYRTQTYYIWMH